MDIQNELSVIAKINDFQSYDGTIDRVPHNTLLFKKLTKLLYHYDNNDDDDVYLYLNLVHVNLCCEIYRMFSPLFC